MDAVRRPRHGDTLIIGPGTSSGPNVADVRHVPLNDLTVLLDDGPGLVGSPYIPTLSLSDTTIGPGRRDNQRRIEYHRYG